VVSNEAVHRLEYTDSPFDEGWLQDFIFTHPETLPIVEMEPIFAGPIPVCRELWTAAGPIDAVFVNKHGLLTLVECKLWRNPQARREVVAQILDYAKEVSRWHYPKLEEAVRKASGRHDRSLYDLVSELHTDLDEAEFIDAVSRNLKRGRFLLLIVGDGIREDVERIASYLQRHAHLNFAFGLMELAFFQLPAKFGGGYLVHPRVVARTVEIERAVVRIESDQIIAEMPVGAREDETRKGQRGKITEQAFYEALGENSPLARDLRRFLDSAVQLGLVVEPGQNSLKLKSDTEWNFGVFKTDGTFANYGIASTAAFGHPEIGETYLERMATLIDGGTVKRGPTDNRFFWTVRKNDRPVPIQDLLNAQDKWLEIIADTMRSLSEVLGQ
jgi:hypothetical protein